MSFSMLGQSIPFMDTAVRNANVISKDWYQWMRRIWQDVQDIPEDIQEAIDALEAQIDIDISTQVAALELAIDAVDTDVTALETDIADAENAISAIESDVSDLQSDVSDLQTSITGKMPILARTTLVVFEYHVSASSRSTTGVPAANTVLLAPLKPVRDNFTLNAIRMTLQSKAVGLLLLGLYQLSGSTFTAVSGSGASLDTNSGSTGTRDLTLTGGGTLSLSPGQDYFFAAWCDSTTPTFITMQSESIPPLPSFTHAVSSLIALPGTISVASTTKDYTNAGARLVECTYMSTADLSKW